MENAVAKPNTHRREEKLWSEIKSYQVATNNARILGVLDELIINVLYPSGISPVLKT